MGILKKAAPRKKETRIIPDSKDGTKQYIEPRAVKSDEDVLTGETAMPGELSVDVFQTPNEIVVVAPVAGVRPEDLNISVTDDKDKVLTISGSRNLQFKTEQNDYSVQECFWGAFARSIILPEDVSASGVKASFKNGILTVRVPKVERIKTRKVAIKEE